MSSDISKLGSIIKDISKRVEKSLRKRNIPTDVGETAKEMVQKRTRSGFGIDRNEGKKRRLPKLEKATKSRRKGLKKKGTLSNETSPSRSNFTRTGQTLDNIKVSPKNNEVELKLDSHGIEAVRTTEKISEKYNFMGLSRSETKEIKKDIEAEIKKILKNYL